ncbi:methionyl-tRNA formyltransferase [Prochlorothrix hollandica]|uniref:Methionyl-tRNA formyltransferase n=1 Tax=Prochlorothrix hollandica PCC 9006 = CALU 1027 TaxID=317619 RepID=A0A0M2PV83_PROHO|nr:methionyl-tRNA formyltransferase [Prochlorothrix hollandica]KKI99012.1 methionyl-tRNA formyltransferase [Prochlorothrix hollandica PCC 9006 = CALU 1027]
MRVVFFGTPQFAVPSLQILLDSPHGDVVAVVTQPDKRRGRGSQLTPSPIKTLALAHDIPVWQPPRLRKDGDTLALLEASQADFFAVVAYGQLLPPSVLAMARLGCINVHGSLLPAYRGAAPIQWCLYHGERQTGITTMLMDEGMDTGAMIQTLPLEIPLVMQAQELADLLAPLGAKLLRETLEQRWAGNLTVTPQDSSQATYAPLITKEHYCLDWHRSALDLHNQVRGFFPHCTTSLQGQGLKIKGTLPLGLGLTLPEAYGDLQGWSLDPTIAPSPPPPGTLVGLIKQRGPVIQTGAGALLLTQVQLAGKREQSGWDFANGLRLQVGDRLGS